MPITPLEAADVARKHGLSLSDARALAAMAESVEDADTLAAKFAPDTADADADAMAERVLKRGIL